MAGRGFRLNVELDLQATTCPGVWLCPNGRVALRMNMLNARVESRRVSPVFPLIFDEKFMVKKLFTGANTLAELQNVLNDEYIFAELVQWSNSDDSSAVVLATFETNLADLLYPAPCFKGLLAGSEVDLLMEPTKYFPGIIAPKIEVSTRTIIEEVIGICDVKSSGTHVINPKVINSKNSTCVHRKRPSKGIIRQRQVCHTQGQTQYQPNRPTRHRHASIDGTSSSVSTASNNLSQSQIEHCHQRSKDIFKCSHCSSGTREISPFRQSCHGLDNCPVCFKYKCYFSGNDEPKISKNNCEQRLGESLRKIYESSKNRSEIFQRDNDCDKCRSRSAPQGGSLPDASVMLRERTKQLSRKVAKTSHVGGDTCDADYFGIEGDNDRQGFYKNLEKFYKRMYKQAKIRAQQVGCN